jgi:hypothetical protein
VALTQASLTPWHSRCAPARTTGKSHCLSSVCIVPCLLLDVLAWHDDWLIKAADTGRATDSPNVKTADTWICHTVMFCCTALQLLSLRHVSSGRLALQQKSAVVLHTQPCKRTGLHLLPIAACCAASQVLHQDCSEAAEKQWSILCLIAACCAALQVLHQSHVRRSREALQRQAAVLP